MANHKESEIKSSRRQPPATTPEGREKQLIALAMDATERRIRNGTATAQELVYFLKAGSPSTKHEREILKKQEELITAKTDALKSQKRVEELYAKALSAMKKYSGDRSDSDDDEFYD